MSNDDFLSRWSRRKHAVRKGEDLPEAPKPAAAVPASTASTAPQETKPVAELPPIESLTPESDFAPFMHKDVEPGLRRQALKTLFRDPRFNVMDGLDVYIDDFSKPDPIPPDWLGKLNQMARLGDYKPPEADSPKECVPVAEPGVDVVVAENQQDGVELPPPEGAPSSPGSPPPESKQS